MPIFQPRALPAPQGMYNPVNEHDACGVGFVAHIKGRKSHEIVQYGLRILLNLDHRGATGADTLFGDGAGMLLQIPDALLREEMAAQGVTLPPAGEYGVGMIFLPREPASRAACEKELERTVRDEGATFRWMPTCRCRRWCATPNPSSVSSSSAGART